MFQFAGFASRGYVFTPRYLKRGGFPHSEIPGSKCARDSPGLIATCYVLHRLSVPRHPPNALIALDRAKPSHAEINPNRLDDPCVNAFTQRHSAAKSITRGRHERRHRSSLCATVSHNISLFTMAMSNGGGPVPAPSLVRPDRWRRRRSFNLEAGGGERNRTVALLLAKQALSQLSYTPDPIPGIRSSDP